MRCIVEFGADLGLVSVRGFLQSKRGEEEKGEGKTAERGCAGQNSAERSLSGRGC